MSKLMFVKDDKGFLQDIITDYDHFKRFKFWYWDINTQIHTNF